MKVAIVGLGLMGGSLARAISAYTDCSVLGYDVDGSVLMKALSENVISGVLTRETAKSADIVIFALTPYVAEKEMNSICPLLKDGAVVMDICGVKRYIVEKMHTLEQKYPHLHFVGTHPMAGKEYGGFENSDKDLYKGAYIVVTPLGDEFAVNAASNLYMQIGAKGITICTPEEHDKMICYTSQMAHIVSSCYAQNPLSKKHKGYSAGSFGDLTRVARLDSNMWTDLFMLNGDNVKEDIDDIIGRLNSIKTAIENEDKVSLEKILRYGTECKNLADKVEDEKD